MKKRILCCLLLCGTTILPILSQDMTFEHATDAVKNMRVGWNLGNTLDSNSGDTQNMWIEHWANTPTGYETAWGQRVTEYKLFDLFKDAGFNAIRVPVTWYPHMVKEWKFSSYSNSIWNRSLCDMTTYIDPAWMARVHEIVDYVIDHGMYCIINVHHDTGSADTAWLTATAENYERNHELYEWLWTQIANEFKDYGERLLFESYNEMLDGWGSWCFASFASPSRYDATAATATYRAINDYAQSFVDAVRATGGNNTQRNLIVNTYGACSGSGTWNDHLKDPLKEMALPHDISEGHLAFEIHTYPNVSSVSSVKSEVNDMINALRTHLVSKGAPVIIGEWGSSNVDSEANDYIKQRSNLLEFARYLVERAKAEGMATFYWMGLSDGDDRTIPRWTQPDLVDAIIKGYYGEGGYDAAIYNILNDEDYSDSVKSPSFDLQGRPSNQEQHGIIIKDGHKYLIK